MENHPNQLDEWRQEIKAYEKSKRTKKPHGKSLPKIEYVTYRDMKQKQTEFNPVLQMYRDPRKDHLDFSVAEKKRNDSLMRQVNKEKRYSLPYDIINLHGSQRCGEEKSPDPNKKLGPVRNIYNVINNQMLPDTFFRDRDVRLSLDRPRHVVKKNMEDYDMVTGRYRENDEKKQKQIDESMRNSAWIQYEKGRTGLDHLSGKFYNPEVEDKYQQYEQHEHNRLKQSFSKKLPPSYVNRQSVVLDPTKEVPETFKTLDLRRDLAKRRYQMRYLVEDEYQRRNVEDDEKVERVTKNHVHDGRIWEEKLKQYDIINSKNAYRNDRADQLFGRAPVPSTWAKTTLQPKIKSGGFE